MSRSAKSLLPLLILAALIGWLACRKPSGPTPVAGPQPSPATPGPATAPPPVPPVQADLSPLGSPPDWEMLDSFQGTITRNDFERLLTTIFTTGDAWKRFISISGTEAVIATGSPSSGMRFHLRFAPEAAATNAPRHWRTARELPPAPAERPLEGLRIAIDPGHIGGEWAKMEERSFALGGDPPIREGNMTLEVARLIKPKLEALGATVTLVRNSNEPITPIRPESLLAEAQAHPGAMPDARKAAERLFYRTAEIRARAVIVNRTIKPDLVLCLHFNAEPWTGAALLDRSHFHLLLNGGYTDDEVMLSDQRFEMLHKLLQRSHDEEASVGRDVASAFHAVTGLPPYTYNLSAKNVRSVDGNPFLWARNLLANRLYDCPVVFLEPYVMNSREDYARMQAGDYEGLREIHGKPRVSIFREYADALTKGLADHYRQARPQAR